jgi:hypothetical protein
VRFNAWGIVTGMEARMNQVKNVFSRRKDSICSEKKPTLLISCLVNRLQKSQDARPGGDIFEP